MIDGAVALLASRGMEGTSFADVLERTGAPRGSIYHHFPDGKDELIGAAIGEALGRAMAVTAAHAGAPAVEVAEAFLGAWGMLLGATHCGAGCALVAVAVDTGSAPLREQAGAAFRTWLDHLAGLLEQGGLSRPAAQRHAVLLLAGAEGAVVLSRAMSEPSAFDSVAASLLDGIRRETGG
jgi:TetR/AcrR family transcriptional regulator, lmrAB and yxaGH operons repressor